MNIFKKIIYTIYAITLSLFLVGCNDKSEQKVEEKSERTLTILASSELKDMENILKKAQTDLNINLSIQYSGTISAVDKIKNGMNVDTAWLSQSKYFYDTQENSKRIKLSEKTMVSPVIIGFRKDSWNKLNVKNEKITWKKISEWVKNNKLTYAMSDPSESNTGYITLMGVSYSIANTGENLKVSDIPKEKIEEFFKGNTVKAQGSYWLMEEFKNSKADFIINYESVLLTYNINNKNDELVLVYPDEGISSADYPLLLINPKKQEIYKELVEYLKTIPVQKAILEETKRRPLMLAAARNQTYFDENKLLIEMPFDPSPELADEILTAYFQNFKKPSAFAFVLDTSGSMSIEQREQKLKKAMASLTIDNNKGGKFAKIREREMGFILPFSDSIGKEYFFNITKENKENELKGIFNYVNSLNVNGGTALYLSTAQAIKTLNNIRNNNVKNGKDYTYSVVLLTDGENNGQFDLNDFVRFMDDNKAQYRDIRVFPILFGAAKLNELNVIANSTKGKVFDGNNKSLNEVFKEIRSYQ